MTDIRDEPVEDKKISQECGQSESRWGELQVNETGLLLKQRMEASAADVLLTRGGRYLVAVKDRTDNVRIT
jgi:hypothetical protein